MSYQYPESGGDWREPGSGWSGGTGSGPYGGIGGGYGGGYGSGYGGGFGPPPPPQPPYTDPYAAPPDRTSTIWAPVVGILSFFCCTTNVIAIIFAAIALSKDREPEEMERFTRYAWISTGIHVAVGLVLVVLWLMFIAWVETA